MNSGTRLAWGLAALVVVRLVYLAQYLQLPFVFGPLFDSQVYIAQAEAIRAGQFADPTLLAFSPLYGYYLALFGTAPGALLPLFVQLLLGIANVLLVRHITTRAFGARAGLWAALAWSLYGPLLLFETKLMSETLGLGLLLLAVERFGSPAFARGQASAIAACGLALALAVLARASLLMSLPCFVLFAALLRGPSDAPPELGLRARRSLGLALVIATLLGGYGAFNKQQSGLFVPVIMVSNTVAQTTSQGDWSGSLANLTRDQQVGAFSVVKQAATRLAAIRAGKPDPAAARGTLQGLDLLGWLRQLPHKVWLTVRDQETTFDYAFYGERSEVAALHLTFATFGLLLCLASIGVLIATRNGLAPRLLTLVPVVAGIFATTTLFHPSTRYRLPLLVVLAPLTGLTLERAGLTWRAGERRLGYLVALLVVGFTLRGATRDLAHPGSWHLRVAESAALAGDLPECRARVRTALALEPDSADVQARVQYVASINRGCGPR